MQYRKYMCLLCGFVYSEEQGWPDEGVSPGTKWEDIPENWLCPECGASKLDFEMVEM
jgi:rubredoxin